MPARPLSSPSSSTSVSWMSKSSIRPSSRPIISAKASTVQPTVGHSGVARTPKCQGRGGRLKAANSTAAPTNTPSWSSASTSSAIAPSVSEIPASSRSGSSGTIASEIATRLPISATGAYQGGQRGPGGRGQLGWIGQAPQRSTATKSSARSSPSCRRVKSRAEIAGVKRS